MTSSENATILVIYDSKSIRDTVSILDDADDYRLIELDAPSDVSAALDEARPDVVILCAMAKETAALTLCPAIKEARQDEFLPVIVYSLKSGTAEREAAYAAGADVMVQVTISPEALQGHVRYLLRVRGIVQEATGRCRSLARASAEAASMMLKFEEAGRRIQEQNEQIKAQQVEIENHLTTLRTELELAEKLQIAFLPNEQPADSRLSVASRYIAAENLGGDYYDYVSTTNGAFLVSIADVTGHGVASALVSVQVRAMGRVAALEGNSPAEILTRLNHFVCETFQQSYLLTMLCLVSDPESDEIIVSGAGHCPLIILPGNNAEASEIYSTGMPLGVMPTAKFTDSRVKLGAGDRLFCYTDGITEAANAAQEQFGTQRLIDTLVANQGQDGEATLGACLEKAREFSGQKAFIDDITMVLLERCRG